MHSLTGEVIFGGDIMRFSEMVAALYLVIHLQAGKAPKKLEWNIDD